MRRRIKPAWLGSLIAFVIMEAVVVIMVTACAYLPGWLGGDEDEPSAPPSWDKCTLASCWDGANASNRYMNTLSPHFTDAKFREYLQKQKARGCNTTHQILCNRADGQGAPYSIYTKSSTWSWTVDPSIVATMKSRIQAYRDEGFAVVIWLLTDDSAPWAREIEKNFQRYLNDVKAAGLLDQASIVVVGLELGEYYSAPMTRMEYLSAAYRSARVSAFIQATRNVYSGKIGTHENSGHYKYAHMADICFYQVSPGKSVAWIENEARRVKKAIGGKPLNFFEIERQPNRAKSEAALRGGAYAVGNW